MRLPAPRTAILPPLLGYCSCAVAAKPGVVVELSDVRLNRELPAYPELTMCDHVIVLPEGSPEIGYANFSSGFSSQVNQMPSEVFAPERIDQAGQNFRLTAVIPCDQTIQWTQYTSPYVFSIALASPIVSSGCKLIHSSD